MNRFLRGWMLPILLGLPLTKPLWLWTSVPCTHDGHLHYHRVAALKHMWESGLYFSRWMPDLAFGYGYPFFIYREPLPLYAVLVPHWLGLPLSAASNLFYALCILAAGVGMFLWVRDLFGEMSGVVSGMAYMAAPYVLIDAFVRGNAPESIGLAVMPWLLWAGRRWMVYRTWKAFLGTVLGLGVLGLSHNISVLLFVPTLFIYLVCVGFINRRGTEDTEGRRKIFDRRGTEGTDRGGIWGVLGRVLLVLGLGVGLTIWYTGAAVLELDEITISQSTTTRNNDFHFNYATLGEIFSGVRPENNLELNRPLHIRLGWMPVTLGIMGVVMGLWQGSREQKWHVGLMVVGAGAFLFLALEQSEWLWENVPLIDFVQFPWRMVGRAALPVALLAGIPFGDFYRRGTEDTEGGMGRGVLRWVLFCGVAGLLFLEVVPYLYPVECDEKAFPTISDVHAYERRSGLVGVDPEGSYFPKTVGVRPEESPLEEDYTAGRVPERFVGDGVVEVVYGNNSVDVVVDVDEAFTATYRAFAFPGWAVEVDGERVEMVPSVPDGLMTFGVSAGRHEIEVFWAGTWARKGLIGVSVVVGLGVVMGVFFTQRREWGRIRRNVFTTEAQRRWRGRVVLTAEAQREQRVGWLVVLGMLGVIGVHEWMDTGLRYDGLPDVAVSGEGVRVQELELVGYDVSDKIVPSGETFDVDLAWLVVGGVPGGKYQANVWIADERGVRWSEKGTERPRLYEDAGRTDFWLPGHWAWDSHEVQLLRGTPAGTYRLMVSMFDLGTLRPFQFNYGEVEVEIGEVEVGLNRFDRRGAEGTEEGVLDFWMDREVVRPGDPVLMTLFWGVGDSVEHKLELVKDGVAVQAWDVGGVVSREMMVREQILGRVRADLVGGVYNLRLVNHRGTEDTEVLLGELTVQAIERRFELGGDVRPVDYRLEEGIRLVGVREDAPQLELFWQIDNVIGESYRVFVHLVGESGAIVNQSDGEPGGWERPTTSWIPGEFVQDVHVVEGDGVAWRVGLYDGVSGERLMVDGGDVVVLDVLNRRGTEATEGGEE